MVTILDEILVKLPRDAMISGTAYEWANIVLYTKNKAFFHHGFDSIKQLVDEFKKRIELRADASIRMDTEKTEKFIRKTIPGDAEMAQILFEPARSVVTIEAKHPGAAIGRDGELLKAIKEETLWIPIVRRESIIPSKITANIRRVLYEDSEYRRKFLDRIGKRIYEQRQQVDEMWARVSFLGGGRQVGRSCLYLQTPQSKVLLDCGINVAAQGKYAFPYMNAPEFHIEDVDAVIISHSHLDHCLTSDTLVQLSDGDIAPITDVSTGQGVEALDFKHSLEIESLPAIQRGAIKAPSQIYGMRTQTKQIKATGNHPVFTLDESGELAIKHIEQLRQGDFIATPRILNVRGCKQILPELYGLAIALDKNIAQILGYILGDGGKREPGAIYITDKNMENLRFYSRKLTSLGVKTKISSGERNRINIYSRRFKEWIEKISPHLVCKSPYRKIPKAVCKSQKEIIAAFLRGLYDAEGCIKHHSIVLSTSSEHLAIMLQMLLLRFGIISHNYSCDSSRSTFGGGPAYQICVSNPDSIKIFSSIIGFSDKRKAAKLRAMNARVGGGIVRVDLMPIGKKVLLEIAKELGLRKVDLIKLGINYGHYSEHFPSRQKLIEICKKLSKVAMLRGVGNEKLEHLSKLASAQIFWDKVISIKAIEAEEEVYDLTIPGHSNYIANGIFVHNCGFLPYLFKMGYRGPVYCTEATRDTMALLMLDFVEVSHGNNKDVLYSSADIKECIKHTVCLDYGEVTDITPDVRITLYNAGHILGSAMVHLHLGEGWHNLLYTGDYKVKKTLLLNPAQTIFPRVETLMTESTYGASDDIMPSREDCEAQILKIIKDTIERKGKVLMPTLGVGRSQEVMILLQKFCHEHNLEIPFYIDGMVWDVTAIHNAYPGFLSQEIKEKVFYENNDPLLDKMFRQVGSSKERKAVLEGPPCVIVATSGMLTGGPALSYLKELASNPKNSLVFTCYQGEGSLGSKIQKGEKRLQIDEDQIDMKMEVFTISGLSGHADRNELLSYMNNIKPRPRKVIIIHGENTKTIDLASAIHKNFKVETTAPRNLEAVRLR